MTHKLLTRIGGSLGRRNKSCSHRTLQNCHIQLPFPARFVDLKKDYICGFIGYKSTFIVGNKSTINVGNKSWLYILSWIRYNIFPQIQTITNIQPIEQQILLYCSISSDTTRFVDFIGNKPTNLGIIWGSVRNCLSICIAQNCIGYHVHCTGSFRKNVESNMFVKI